MVIVITEINYRRHLVGIFQTAEKMIEHYSKENDIEEWNVEGWEDWWGPKPSDYSATKTWNIQPKPSVETYEEYLRDGAAAYEIPDTLNVSFGFDDD